MANGLSEALSRCLERAGESRGRLKQEGRWLDAQPRSERETLAADARRRGIDLPEDAADWPAKKLLRACLDRSDAAQVRTNPIHRDEDFACLHCGVAVGAHGRTARDHCPHCLRSLHVDVVPGDRAADCGGLLDPVSLELRGSELVLHYRCRRCGASRTNRAVQDGDPPDDPRQLAALSARVGG